MAMHQITDRVWLGSITAVGATRTLKKHNVTHVLSLLSPDINAYIAGPSNDHTLAGHVKDFKHLRIDIDDVEDENIMQYFDQTNAFIDDAVRNGGSVLVHCMAGVSRSATAVMAHLMRSNFWTREQAYNHVKKCRPVANPNSAFFDQLQIYYECGFEVSDDKPIYRQYLLKLKAEDASTGVAPQAVYSPETGSVQLTRERMCFQVLPDILRKLGIKKGWETCRIVVGDDVLPLDAPFPRLDPQTSSLVKLRVSEDRPDIPLTVSILSSEQIAELRCKKCRQLLGTSSQLILHTPLTNIPSQNTRNGMSATSLLDPSCTSYFMEPVSWMRPELEQGKLEGKFACPRCQSKLGAYHWQGAKCSCGTWVTPGITIQRGRVDEAKRVVRAKA